MGFEVDWRHGAEHMWSQHEVSVEQASQALADDGLVFVDPDPASTSGRSARVLGYSPGAVAVLVVILVHREDKPGAWWGANGWRANASGLRIYREHQRASKEDSDE
ncbi:MAG: transposase [Actinomycetota bacterium]|nr:transposase [Actinomycetota bacterium]